MFSTGVVLFQVIEGSLCNTCLILWKGRILTKPSSLSKFKLSFGAKTSANSEWKWHWRLLLWNVAAKTRRLLKLVCLDLKRNLKDDDMKSHLQKHAEVFSVADPTASKTQNWTTNAAGIRRNDSKLPPVRNSSRNTMKLSGTTKLSLLGKRTPPPSHAAL